MSRIVFLTPFDPRPSHANKMRAKLGGVERYVRALSKELVRLGYSVTVIASAGINATFTDDGVEYRLIRRWGVPGGTACFPWPMSVIRESGDLLHVQATYPLVTEVAPYVAQIRNVPSVVTCHFDVVGRDSREASIASAYYLLAGLHGYASYDRVIYTTKGYALASRSAPVVDDSRVRIIPLGVDTSVFHVQDDIAKDHSILFVGRLAWFKGVDVLLDAFAAVDGAPDWTLRIVGRGPMTSRVAAEISKRNLRAEILADVTDDELSRLYNAASITLLPSVARQESFGLTLLESMACGTPVAASDWPGVRDIAALGGSLVTPRDSSTLASTIRAAISREPEAAERHQLSAKIAQSFAWPLIARRTAEVYQELL